MLYTEKAKNYGLCINEKQVREKAENYGRSMCGICMRNLFKTE
jgi:hypothetical protein